MKRSTTQGNTQPTKTRSHDDPDISVETAAADDAIVGKAFLGSLVVFAFLGGLILLMVNVMHEPAKEVVAAPSEVALPRIREAPPDEVPAAKWVDITAKAGIDFRHVTGARGDKLLPETMGGGCAFLDYDADGDQDLLLVNGCEWPGAAATDSSGQAPEPATSRLYQNDGKGNFTNVTKEAGLDVSFYGMGVAAADYDNDGWIDLFISAVGMDRLFRNDHGVFRDVTAETGVGGTESEWGTSCCWFDMENDGDLDLFVGNYVRWSREIDSSQFPTLDGVNRAYGPPFAFEGTFPYLYRNEGGKFIEVSDQAGMRVKNPNTQVPMAKTMGVACADIDGDGRMDILVANDTVQNFVFHNQGNGRFQEIGAICGVAFDSLGNARGAMGIDAARYRNSNSLGIAVGNFANEMTALYVSHEDPMQFVDASMATGLGPATRLSLTFGLFFFDYDLDGRLDLLTANGHLEEDINKVQPTQHYAQPPKLFWNCGPSRAAEFVPVEESKCGPDLGKRMVGRGSAFADIDGDGDLDVLIAANGGAPRLLRNDQATGNHWLRIRLIGKGGNRDSIGASVTLHQGDEKIRREVTPTKSYLSQSELTLTFGLGDTTEVDKLTIQWPSGLRQELIRPAIDQTLVIEQSE